MGQQMKEFLEQLIIYIFAGFTIAGVIGIGIIIVCLVIDKG